MIFARIDRHCLLIYYTEQNRFLKLKEHVVSVIDQWSRLCHCGNLTSYFHQAGFMTEVSVYIVYIMHLWIYAISLIVTYMYWF